MITAGPTYEKIDPVRFIGNYSSGKMGFALAEECARRGAQVTLITGPVQLKTKHSRIRRVDVESAEEMYAAAQIYFPDADAGYLCAAVADYRPETVADKKIKREKEEELTLHLQATQDIAALSMILILLVSWRKPAPASFNELSTIKSKFLRSFNL